MRILCTGIRMKSLALALAFTSFVPAVGQRVPNEAKSPKQMVEEFVRSDLDGERLTEKGRSKLSGFFVQQSQPQKDEKIVVVSPEYDLRQAELSSDRAKFHVLFRQFYGKLDSVLDFEPAPDRASNGVLIKGGILSSFTLIRVGKHGGSEPLMQEKANVDGDTEWKIDGSQPPVCISLATARRYLSEISTADGDPTRRNNASRALATLRKKNK